jgi:hypothetical protein
MADSNDLLLLGVGILIGLGFVTVLLLVYKQTQQPILPYSYVEVPKSIRS